MSAAIIAILVLVALLLAGSFRIRVAVCSERSFRTDEDEFYQVEELPADLGGLEAALLAWNHLYETVRPHQALVYKTPQTSSTGTGSILIPPESNCLESQEEWPATVGVRSHQGERCLSMELRITSSLRMQAVRANFFGLPAASSRW